MNGGLTEILWYLLYVTTLLVPSFTYASHNEDLLPSLSCILFGNSGCRYKCGLLCYSYGCASWDPYCDGVYCDCQEQYAPVSYNEENLSEEDYEQFENLLATKFRRSPVFEKLEERLIDDYPLRAKITHFLRHTEGSGQPLKEKFKQTFPQIESLLCLLRPHPLPELDRNISDEVKKQQLGNQETPATGWNNWTSWWNRPSTQLNNPANQQRIIDLVNGVEKKDDLLNTLQLLKQSGDAPLYTNIAKNFLANGLIMPDGTRILEPNPDPNSVKRSLKNDDFLDAVERRIEEEKELEKQRKRRLKELEAKQKEPVPSAVPVQNNNPTEPPLETSYFNNWRFPNWFSSEPATSTVSPQSGGVPSPDYAEISNYKPSIGVDDTVYQNPRQYIEAQAYPQTAADYVEYNNPNLEGYSTQPDEYSLDDTDWPNYQEDIATDFTAPIEPEWSNFSTLKSNEELNLTASEEMFLTEEISDEALSALDPNDLQLKNSANAATQVDENLKNPTSKLGPQEGISVDDILSETQMHPSSTKEIKPNEIEIPSDHDLLPPTSDEWTEIDDNEIMDLDTRNMMPSIGSDNQLPSNFNEVPPGSEPSTLVNPVDHNVSPTIDNDYIFERKHLSRLQGIIIPPSSDSVEEITVIRRKIKKKDKDLVEDPVYSPPIIPPPSLINVQLEGLPGSPIVQIDGLPFKPPDSNLLSNDKYTFPPFPTDAESNDATSITPPTRNPVDNAENLDIPEDLKNRLPDYSTDGWGLSSSQQDESISRPLAATQFSNNRKPPVNSDFLAKKESYLEMPKTEDEMIPTNLHEPIEEQNIPDNVEQPNETGPLESLQSEKSKLGGFPISNPATTNGVTEKSKEMVNDYPVDILEFAKMLQLPDDSEFSGFENSDETTSSNPPEKYNHSGWEDGSFETIKSVESPMVSPKDTASSKPTTISSDSSISNRKLPISNDEQKGFAGHTAPYLPLGDEISALPTNNQLGNSVPTNRINPNNLDAENFTYMLLTENQPHLPGISDFPYDSGFEDNNSLSPDKNSIIDEEAKSSLSNIEPDFGDFFNTANMDKNPMNPWPTDDNSDLNSILDESGIPQLDDIVDDIMSREKPTIENLKNNSDDVSPLNELGENHDDKPGMQKYHSENENPALPSSIYQNSNETSQPKGTKDDLQPPSLPNIDNILFDEETGFDDLFASPTNNQKNNEKEHGGESDSDWLLGNDSTNPLENFAAKGVGNKKSKYDTLTGDNDFSGLKDLLDGADYTTIPSRNNKVPINPAISGHVGQDDAANKYQDKMSSNEIPKLENSFKTPLKNNESDETHNDVEFDWNSILGSGNSDQFDDFINDNFEDKEQSDEISTNGTDDFSGLRRISENTDVIIVPTEKQGQYEGDGDNINPILSNSIPGNGFELNKQTNLRNDRPKPLLSDNEKITTTNQSISSDDEFLKPTTKNNDNSEPIGHKDHEFDLGSFFGIDDVDQFDKFINGNSNDVEPTIKKSANESDIFSGLNDLPENVDATNVPAEKINPYGTHTDYKNPEFVNSTPQNMEKLNPQIEPQPKENKNILLENRTNVNDILKPISSHNDNNKLTMPDDEKFDFSNLEDLLEDIDITDTPTAELDQRTQDSNINPILLKSIPQNNDKLNQQTYLENDELVPRIGENEKVPLNEAIDLDNILKPEIPNYESNKSTKPDSNDFDLASFFGTEDEHPFEDFINNNSNDAESTDQKFAHTNDDFSGLKNLFENVDATNVPVEKINQYATDNDNVNPELWDRVSQNRVNADQTTGLGNMISDKKKLLDESISFDDFLKSTILDKENNSESTKADNNEFDFGSFFGIENMDQFDEFVNDDSNGAEATSKESTNEIDDFSGLNDLLENDDTTDVPLEKVNPQSMVNNYINPKLSNFPQTEISADQQTNSGNIIPQSILNEPIGFDDFIKSTNLNNDNNSEPSILDNDLGSLFELGGIDQFDNLINDHSNGAGGMNKKSTVETDDFSGPNDLLENDDAINAPLEKVNNQIADSGFINPELSDLISKNEIGEDQQTDLSQPLLPEDDRKISLNKPIVFNDFLKSANYNNENKSEPILSDNSEFDSLLGIEDANQFDDSINDNSNGAEATGKKSTNEIDDFSGLNDLLENDDATNVPLEKVNPQSMVNNYINPKLSNFPQIEISADQQTNLGTIVPQHISNENYDKMILNEPIGFDDFVKFTNLNNDNNSEPTILDNDLGSFFGVEAMNQFDDLINDDNFNGAEATSKKSTNEIDDFSSLNDLLEIDDFSGLNDLLKNDDATNVSPEKVNPHGMSNNYINPKRSHSINQQPNKNVEANNIPIEKINQYGTNNDHIKPEILDLISPNKVGENQQTDQEEIMSQPLLRKGDGQMLRDEPIGFDDFIKSSNFNNDNNSEPNISDLTINQFDRTINDNSQAAEGINEKFTNENDNFSGANDLLENIPIEKTNQHHIKNENINPEISNLISQNASSEDRRQTNLGNITPQPMVSKDEEKILLKEPINFDDFPKSTTVDKENSDEFDFASFFGIEDMDQFDDFMTDVSNSPEIRSKKTANEGDDFSGLVDQLENIPIEEISQYGEDNDYISSELFNATPPQQGKLNQPINPRLKVNEKIPLDKTTNSEDMFKPISSNNQNNKPAKPQSDELDSDLFFGLENINPSNLNGAEESEGKPTIRSDTGPGLKNILNNADNTTVPLGEEISDEQQIILPNNGMSDSLHDIGIDSQPPSANKHNTAELSDGATNFDDLFESPNEEFYLKFPSGTNSISTNDDLSEGENGDLPVTKRLLNDYQKPSNHPSDEPFQSAQKNLLPNNFNPSRNPPTVNPQLYENVGNNLHTDKENIPMGDLKDNMFVSSTPWNDVAISSQPNFTDSNASNRPMNEEGNRENKPDLLLQDDQLPNGASIFDNLEGISAESLPKMHSQDAVKRLNSAEMDIIPQLKVPTTETVLDDQLADLFNDFGPEINELWEASNDSPLITTISNIPNGTDEMLTKLPLSNGKMVPKTNENITDMSNQSLENSNSPLNLSNPIGQTKDNDILINPFHGSQDIPQHVQTDLVNNISTLRNSQNPTSEDIIETKPQVTIGFPIQDSTAENNPNLLNNYQPEEPIINPAENLSNNFMNKFLSNSSNDSNPASNSMNNFNSDQSSLGSNDDMFPYLEENSHSLASFETEPTKNLIPSVTKRKRPPIPTVNEAQLQDLQNNNPLPDQQELGVQNLPLTIVENEKPDILNVNQFSNNMDTNEPKYLSTDTVFPLSTENLNTSENTFPSNTDEKIPQKKRSGNPRKPNTFAKNLPVDQTLPIRESITLVQAELEPFADNTSNNNVQPLGAMPLEMIGIEDTGPKIQTLKPSGNDSSSLAISNPPLAETINSNLLSDILPDIYESQVPKPRMSSPKRVSKLNFPNSPQPAISSSSQSQTEGLQPPTILNSAETFAMSEPQKNAEKITEDISNNFEYKNPAFTAGNSLDTPLETFKPHYALDDDTTYNLPSKFLSSNSFENVSSPTLPQISENLLTNSNIEMLESGDEDFSKEIMRDWQKKEKINPLFVTSDDGESNLQPENDKLSNGIDLNSEAMPNTLEKNIALPMKQAFNSPLLATQPTKQLELELLQKPKEVNLENSEVIDTKSSDKPLNSNAEVPEFLNLLESEDLNNLTDQQLTQLVEPFPTGNETKQNPQPYIKKNPSNKLAADFGTKKSYSPQSSSEKTGNLSTNNPILNGNWQEPQENSVFHANDFENFIQPAVEHVSLLKETNITPQLGIMPSNNLDTELSEESAVKLQHVEISPVSNISNTEDGEEGSLSNFLPQQSSPDVTNSQFSNLFNATPQKIPLKQDLPEITTDNFQEPAKPLTASSETGANNLVLPPKIPSLSSSQTKEPPYKSSTELSPETSESSMGMLKTNDFDDTSEYLPDEKLSTESPTTMPAVTTSPTLITNQSTAGKPKPSSEPKLVSPLSKNSSIIDNNTSNAAAKPVTSAANQNRPAQSTDAAATIFDVSQPSEPVPITKPQTIGKPIRPRPLVFARNRQTPPTFQQDNIVVSSKPLESPIEQKISDILNNFSIEDDSLLSPDLPETDNPLNSQLPKQTRITSRPVNRQFDNQPSPTKVMPKPQQLRTRPKPKEKQTLPTLNNQPVTNITQKPEILSMQPTMNNLSSVNTPPKPRVKPLLPTLNNKVATNTPSTPKIEPTQPILNDPRISNTPIKPKMKPMLPTLNNQLSTNIPSKPEVELIQSTLNDSLAANIPSESQGEPMLSTLNNELVPNIPPKPKVELIQPTLNDLLVTDMPPKPEVKPMLPTLNDPLVANLPPSKFQEEAILPTLNNQPETNIPPKLEVEPTLPTLNDPVVANISLESQEEPMLPTLNNELAPNLQTKPKLKLMQPILNNPLIANIPPKPKAKPMLPTLNNPLVTNIPPNKFQVEPMLPTINDQPAVNTLPKPEVEPMQSTLNDPPVANMPPESQGEPILPTQNNESVPTAPPKPKLELMQPTLNDPLVANIRPESQVEPMLSTSNNQPAANILRKPEVELTQPTLNDPLVTSTPPKPMVRPRLPIFNNLPTTNTSPKPRVEPMQLTLDNSSVANTPPKPKVRPTRPTLNNRLATNTPPTPKVEPTKSTLNNLPATNLNELFSATDGFDFDDPFSMLDEGFTKPPTNTIATDSKPTQSTINLALTDLDDSTSTLAADNNKFTEQELYLANRNPKIRPDILLNNSQNAGGTNQSSTTARPAKPKFSFKRPPTKGA